MFRLWTATPPVPSSSGRYQPGLFSGARKQPNKKKKNKENFATLKIILNVRETLNPNIPQTFRFKEDNFYVVVYSRKIRFMFFIISFCKSSSGRLVEAHWDKSLREFQQIAGSKCTKKTRLTQSQLRRIKSCDPFRFHCWRVCAKNVVYIAIPAKQLYYQVMYSSG